MNWFKDDKKTILFFVWGSLFAFVAATGLFFYADYRLPSKQVLGVQIEGGLSLFSNKVRLLKTANNPAVYVVIGNQKHHLRNEEVFYSYDFNFRNVKTVSQRELDKYQTARLAKAKGSDRTYYLNYAQNLKKYHPTPQAFVTYADNRWEDVLELSSQDLNFWDDAQVLKTTDSSKVYFVKGSTKAWIQTEEEFINGGFSWNKIMTVGKADLDSYETVDYSASLNRQVVSPVQIDSPASAQGQVIATLDNSSPVASLFPFSTSNNIVSAVRLQASGGNVTIKEIIFTKKGIVDSKTVNSVVVEDKSGMELGRANSISSQNTVRVRFSSPLVIPKSSEKVLRLKIGFLPDSNMNQTISFGIQQESDIQTSSSVSGIFPLFGATHKLVSANDLVGQLKVASLVVGQAERQVNIGAKKVIVTKFRLQETSGNEKVAINKIILTNYGTADDTNVDNISLYADGKWLTTTKDIHNEKVEFDLSKKQIIIDKNDSVDLTVKVDVLQGEGKTLKFIIDKSGDIQAKGVSQGFGITVASAESFPIGSGDSDGYNKIVFKREGVGLFAKKLDADDREIFREQTEAVLAEFELRNISSDIYLERMKLQVEKYQNAPNLTGVVKIKDITNKKTVVSIDEERLAGGIVADFSLGNYKITSDKTIKLEVVGDISEQAISKNAYRIVVKEISYKIGDSNKAYTEKIDAYGQVMVVYSPELKLTAGELKNSGKAEAEEENVELARIEGKVSVDEKIKITSITVSLTRDSDEVTYVSGFSDLELYAGNQRAGSKIEQPDSHTYTFPKLNIRVSAGKSVSLMLRADTEIITAGKKVQFKIDSIEAEGYSSHAPVIINGEGIASDAVQIVKPAEEE